MTTLNELAFNKEITLLASTLRTAATYNTDEQTNDGHRGIAVYVDITAEDGAMTLDVKLQTKDHIGGDWADIPGAAIAQQSAVTSAPVVLTLYPGIASTANVSVSDVLPRRWRAVATVAGAATSMTFSVGAVLLR